MKEKEFIQTIKSSLNSKYIGDDCAYLKELGIVISQDSLVEDVHFKMDYTTPFQLGFKSVMVNISDICASGAKPKYLTISLSLPKNIESDFIKDFYEGAKKACNDVEIVGGDITGSEKIFISITAIGETKDRKISSRSNAKVGYKVIVSGEHGNSAQGLKLLLNGITKPKKYTDAHLMPIAQIKFSKEVAENIKENYAMMDTSDGLADALIQISQASNVTLKINTSQIPHDKNLDMETVLYGGEDYQLVAVVPESILKNISNYTIIGEAVEGIGAVEFDGIPYINIESKLYNHFKG